MILGNRKSCTCSELTNELARDPYYGVRLERAETGEPYVEDPNSTELFLTQRNPIKRSGDKTQNALDWEYNPALVTIYQADSENIESILSYIYEVKPHRQSFRDAFMRLPCKENQLLLLVYSWCGPLGLRYSRNGQSPENQVSDLLSNWTSEFQIQLEDLKVFLRQNGWPLPVSIFSGEADHTHNKVNLSDKEFKKLVREQVELLPNLQRRLKELKAIQPESMAADEKKQQEISKVESKIEVLTGRKLTGNTSKPNMTKREARKLATQARNLDWISQAETIRKDNLGIFSTTVAQNISRNQKKNKEKQYHWRTIYKQIISIKMS